MSDLSLFLLLFGMFGSIIAAMIIWNKIVSSLTTRRNRQESTRYRLRPRTKRLSVMSAPILPKQQDQPTVPILSIGEWLRRVNDQPDRTPHLAATGPSGSGKTTLILAILQDRPGRFVICTPKSKRADFWGGLDVVRLRPTDMSFNPIGEAVNAVYTEMLRRNAEDADVNDDWITLIIDEFSTVIGKLPELREKVLDMVTLGRSSRIRIIILSTETNVKAWGWEGRGEARHNVLFIECEEDTHKAVIYRWGKERQAIDTRPVPAIARRSLPTMRLWIAPQSVENTLDRTERENALENTFSAQESDFPLSGNTTEIAIIAAGIAAGKRKTEIIQSLPGYSGRRHGQFVALYEQVVASLEKQTLAA